MARFLQDPGQLLNSGTVLKILLVIITALQSTYIILAITRHFTSADKRDVLCPRMFSFKSLILQTLSLNYSFYFKYEW